MSRCGLDQRSNVLEVGAGAGQATIPILELGAHVTAVEPGRNLANELLNSAAVRNAQHRLRIMNTTYEDAIIEEAAFDLVVAATAFHWVDPKIRMAKSAFALRDHGWLAVWSNRYGDPDRPDPFHEAIQPLIERYAPELATGGDARVERQAQETSSSDSPENREFDEVDEYIFRWEGRHDPQQLRALFSTFSGWAALTVERREPLLDALEALARERFGGMVVRPYRTVLQLRRRKSRENTPPNKRFERTEELG